MSNKQLILLEVGTWWALNSSTSHLGIWNFWICPSYLKTICRINHCHWVLKYTDFKVSNRQNKNKNKWEKKKKKKESNSQELSRRTAKPMYAANEHAVSKVLALKLRLPDRLVTAWLILRSCKVGLRLVSKFLSIIFHIKFPVFWAYFWSSVVVIFFSLFISFFFYQNCCPWPSPLRWIPIGFEQPNWENKIGIHNTQRLPASFVFVDWEGRIWLPRLQVRSIQSCWYWIPFTLNFSSCCRLCGKDWIFRSSSFAFLIPIWADASQFPVRNLVLGFSKVFVFVGSSFRLSGSLMPNVSWYRLEVFVVPWIPLLFLVVVFFCWKFESSILIIRTGTKSSMLLLNVVLFMKTNPLF